MSGMGKMPFDKSSQHTIDLDFTRSFRGKGSLMLPIHQVTPPPPPPSSSCSVSISSRTTKQRRRKHQQYPPQQQQQPSQQQQQPPITQIQQIKKIQQYSEYRRGSSMGTYVDDDGTVASYSSEYTRMMNPNRLTIISALVVFVGLLGASIFVGYGIRGETAEAATLFGVHTEEIELEMEVAWKDYITASKWLHQACTTHNIDREEFQKIHQYISSAVELQSTQWMPKVYHEEREQLEYESRAYYAEFYPEINYTGIVGKENDPTDPSGSSLLPRSVQPFYYPLHFVEPIEPNAAVIEFDAYSSTTEKEVIDLAISTMGLAISKPFLIIQDQDEESSVTSNNQTLSERSILLLQPGLQLPDVLDDQPEDLSVIVVKARSILSRGTVHLQSDMSMYLYGSSAEDESDRHFVIAAEIYANEEDDGGHRMVFLPEVEYSVLTDDSIRTPNLMKVHTVKITPTYQWKVVFVSLDDTYQPNHKTVLGGGIIILFSGMVIAFWLRHDLIRIRKLQETRRQVEIERATLTVNSARQAAKMEQELNDYIAHEVRNPLAAAMSACSFVKAAVEERKPLISEESIASVREDVEIIDTSLAFMNDLLRSMLDMHKAASKKMKLEIVPVDILNDIILPVSAMLYQRNATFEVLTECEENLIIMADRMRLKQVMLNLGRNSSKFVQEGFILLGASVVDGNVRLVVEDSGPGISKEKQKRLFSKFQESLDLTNQGTGMGLCLCKNIVDLLGGEIFLDATYNSGVAGSPGTKFVIDLKAPRMTEKEYAAIVGPEDKNSSGSTASISTSQHDEIKPFSTSVRFVDDKPEENPFNNSSCHSFASVSLNESDMETDPDTLPETLSVLFVDDDMVLRKLFSRSVKKVVPTWNIKEAANGETALKMVETESFDLIFLDQYMASVEKQLLGTETARALRAKGVTSRICGLSANDVAKGFRQAGADDFLFKPFPCKPEELRQLLLKIIHGKKGSK